MLYEILYFKVFSDDIDTMATSSEFKLLYYSCGYWEFPKNDEIRIIDTKYILFGNAHHKTLQRMVISLKMTRRLKEFSN